MAKRQAETVAESGPPAVGQRLQALRHERKLTLDELSRRADVSKSMLSQVERNLTNPTVAIVWRLANALGVELSMLLSEESAARAAIEVVEAHGVPRLASAAHGYELRILGPISLAGRFEWYELKLAPRGELVSEPHEPGSLEHLSVTRGALIVRSGGEERRVEAGATARYPVDVPHAILNATAEPCEALMVVEHRGAAR